MNTRTRAATVTALTILLMLVIPASMNWTNSLPLLAQSSETGGDDDDDNTNSASQDYQEFQSCLSDAEVDGTVSEQQIRDCFAPIYNTGTGTSTAGDNDVTNNPSGDEDTDNEDDNGSDDEE
jgi:hypothetical protein